MGKRKASQATVDAGMAFFADLLKDKGVEVKQEDLYDDISSTTAKLETKIFQAEGVLHFLQSAGKSLVTKECPECKQPFATRYINVAYCSDLCRSGRLRKLYGIRWDPSRDNYSMLDAERPMVVGPEAYKCLVEFAERILHQDILVLQEEQVEEVLPQLDSPEELESLNQVEESTSPEPLHPPLDVPVQSDRLVFDSLDSPVQW